MQFRWFVAVALLAAWSAHAQQQSNATAFQPAPCKNLVGSVLHLRDWRINNQTLNATTVLGIFQREFAPMVESEPGFQELVGAASNNSFVVLFDVFMSSNQTMNQTSNATSAAGGQSQQTATQGIGGAPQFIQGQQQLAGQLTSISDINGTIAFDYFNADLCQQTIAHNNTWMALRVYELLPNATLDNTGVLTAFNGTFVTDLRDTTGFREFIGASAGMNRTVFIDVFETQQQAQQSNAASQRFVNASSLNGQIMLVDSLVAQVAFDALGTQLTSNSTSTSPSTHSNSAGGSA